MNALRTLYAFIACNLGWLVLALVLSSTTCNQVENQSSTASPTPTRQIAILATPSPTPPPSPTPIQDISIGRWKIVPQKYKAVSHKLKYSITGEYPLIRSTDPRAARFARAIQNKISKQYAYATHPNRKDFYERGAFSKDDPLETAEFSYEILFANDELLSIRFSDMTYSAGAAHPLENYFSLNFDLRRRTVFQIRSLFKPNVRVMSRLVKLSKKGLDEQSVSTDEDAVEAELRQHLEWNITRSGLMINFDRCAVASCGYGERSVVIPYDDLKELMRQNSALLLKVWPGR